MSHQPLTRARAEELIRFTSRHLHLDDDVGLPKSVIYDRYWKVIDKMDQEFSAHQVRIEFETQLGDLDVDVDQECLELEQALILGWPPMDSANQIATALHSPRQEALIASGSFHFNPQAVFVAMATVGNTLINVGVTLATLWAMGVLS